LEKVLQTKGRAVVLATEENRKALNDSLWTYHPDSFLPHGSTEEGTPEQHPVWLTATLENPNQSNFLVVTSGLPIPALEGFETCLYLFDSNREEELKTARNAWSQAKGAGHDLTYWQQTDQGNWEKKDL
jgi:DNA polymerase-3 subunit chi